MTTFLDTNVLIALLDDKHPHHQWAARVLVDRKAVGPAIVSSVVYAEFTVGMNTKEEADEALSTLALDRISENDDSLFRAGRAFLKYKKENKGPKESLMPDFFVGAVAEIMGAPLMTANGKDYAGYFDHLVLIHP